MGRLRLPAVRNVTDGDVISERRSNRGFGAAGGRTRATRRFLIQPAISRSHTRWRLAAS